jgi:hypothetical protein
MTESQEQTIQMLKWFRDCHANNGVPQSWFYKGPADLLLREGKWYDEGHVIDWKRSVPQACFRNAALYAMLHRLPYIEGYATGIIPVHHAWCLDAVGRVCEVTWKELGTDYFGVAFKPNLVTRGAVLFNEQDCSVYTRKVR